VFRAGTDIAMLMKQFESDHGVLQHAMQMERDSILFYVGLRGAVPPEFGKLSVDELIKEEMGHVARLKEALADLDAPPSGASA
jgi:rubrerythrin